MYYEASAESKLKADFLVPGFDFVQIVSAENWARRETRLSPVLNELSYVWCA